MGFDAGGGGYSRTAADARYSPAWQSGTHAARIALTGVATGTPFFETDTGVLYRYSGSAWVAQSPGRVVKTADETVNNSAVLQDDDHLFFPVEANESWYVEVTALMTAVSATADYLIGWSGPAGATATWSHDSGANSAWVNVAVGGTPNTMKTLSDTVTVGALAGTFGTRFSGVFNSSATAGTIKFRWAQNTQTAENSKILLGSNLRLTRLV